MVQRRNGRGLNNKNLLGVIFNLRESNSRKSKYRCAAFIIIPWQLFGILTKTHEFQNKTFLIFIQTE